MKIKKKILLVEDFSGEANGIIHRLKELPDYDLAIDWVDDCDKALKKLKTTLDYDLVITDLHFKDEGTTVAISEGDGLIINIKKLEKVPFIIVYSMINQPVVLDLIINSIGVDAYIIKGRKSLDELAYSLNLIFIGGQYISKEAKLIMDRNRNAMSIGRMDRAILRKLYQGFKIKQLPDELKKDGFTTCGRATIENRIKELKDYFNTETTIQLVAVAKEKKVFMG